MKPDTSRQAHDMSSAPVRVVVVEAIVRDQRSVLTVSSLLDGAYGIDNVCLSLPCVVGRHGIERRLDVELSDEELAGLHNSARVLQEIIEQLDVSST